MRAQWKPRVDLLLEELDRGPSILRLSYLADVEAPGLVDRRLDAVKQLIEEAWEARDRYTLTIETEVFWRRGAPRQSPAAGLFDSVLDALPSVDAGPPLVESQPGESAERHLPIDEPFTRWSQDPERLETELGDKLEGREVVAERPETVKLRNVIPPIRFESGVADIPVSYVERLRGILDSMQHLHDVRLHLVGHADDQPLSETLSGIYGDNQGLSRERAGEVAEFLQQALSLPPESISFAWAGADQPIAPNATAQGRALNRRVEVEVWYDEFREELSVEEVVVPEEIKRVKICRTETVCKLRYREGHARRARVRNLIPPLHFGENTVDVPEEFIGQVAEALHNLRDKRNVTVKLIGFTDDVPLTGRAERIYGTHLALSKARSRRVALAVQDALDLPNAAIASDGRGAARPIASNETARGRALNRRVEVEFWHDDPLQELPDEPQPCPDAADAETVTRVYDPPWGRIAPLPVEDGEIRIPEGYAGDLTRAMADVAQEDRVRLRFVGYTRNERLDRRTALVYGDDIGLSAARARRAMERIQTELELSDDQVEHEGRGYVHSNDVVNGGFIQGDTDHVVVRVVYDELALLDDYEGVEVTPITRELEPKDPLALNLMRITVDGEPIDDPGRSLADIQRCTDVALERADVRFRFDNLASTPRLSVTSEPSSVPVGPSSEAGAGTSLIRFRMYSNYSHFIERSEVRIFDRDESLRSEPLAAAEVDRNGFAQWQAGPGSFEAPVRELKFVLRAYDAEGRFDETAPQALWLIYGDTVDDEVRTASEDPEAEPQDGGPEPLDPALQGELLAGYGESGPLARNIPLDNVGTVTVHGSDVPPGHTVWVAGAPVPVDEEGNFVADAVLPAGMHTVEVAVLDEAGNGELFLRDLEFERNDWFYVGIADLTVSDSHTSGPAGLLEGENAPTDRDSNVDGRLAFYLTGKFGENWKLTASADTREEPVEDLFSNFMDKSPEALLRRIDPDYYYPTFGDDSTVEETAPTLGKFYLKLSKDESHALWGNFKVGYLDNELAHVDRGLYGANLHYQTLATTSFGEQRLLLDGFAADPGTIPSREEFRGTGGSLYFLRRHDLLVGSERVRIEVRDKDSGLVTGVVHLRYGLDYDIDYFRGRIVLSEPLPSTVDDDLLVRSGGLSGNQAWLVVQYEFTPGLDEIDTLATGGNGQVWLTDFLKLGVTANRNQEEHVDSSLYAADVTLRASSQSWLKVQAGRSEGLVSSSLRSDDGGFEFLGTGGPGIEESDDAFAYRADLSLGFGDLLERARGRLSVYAQRLEENYSAPGQTALTDTDQLGGSLELPVTDWLRIGAKADWLIQDSGLEILTQEADVGYQFTDHWSLSAGVRNELREDDSPLVPLTQEEGERTDTVLQLSYDTRDRWRAYAFGQATVRATDDREDNSRAGVGGAYRISDWLRLDGEVSHGDLGLAAKVGTSYQQSERTNLYLTYALENERALNGVHARQGNLVAGARTRFSDSGSVFVENRYQHAAATGLTHAVGMDFAPTERLSVGASWESGELRDRQTHAETRRQAGGALLGYRFDKVLLSSGVEYRFDETEQPDGTWTDRRTWLFRNNLKVQLTPDWRLLGTFNHAISDSSLGEFFDGGYTEGVLGYAYRPVSHDRLNVLAKYTYFYNIPTTDQLSVIGTPAQFIQKSHIASVDATYDLFPSLFSIGGKYAFRRGEVSLDRDDPDFFDNDAHLTILRGDLRFLKHWEASAEGRMLHLPDLEERRSGALVTLYRYLGDHFKVGVGYNFTDFSDDLTDLSYDHQGWFFNIVGTL
jgi:flagellar motor protein MotB